jgi:hypothetical protein
VAQNSGGGAEDWPCKSEMISLPPLDAAEPCDKLPWEGVFAP